MRNDWDEHRNSKMARFLFMNYFARKHEVVHSVRLQALGNSNLNRLGSLKALLV